MGIYAYMLENTGSYKYIDNSELIKEIAESGIEEDDVYVDSIEDVERKELGRLIKALKAGDTLLVRSIADISNTRQVVSKALEYFERENIDLVSINESYYTYKEYYQAYLDFTRFERVWREQKRLMGIQRAKLEKKMGRKKSKEKIDMALRLYDTEEFTVREVLKMSNISASTLYRELKKRKKDLK